MKIRLRAGAEVDVLNQQELGQELQPVRDELRLLREAQQQSAPRWQRPDGWAETDANGNVTVTVYRVPQGMELRVQRVLVEADGFDAGTPHVGGGFELWRDDRPAAVQAANQLPADLSISEGAGVRYRNGAQVQVRVLAGPANTRVRALVEGSLHVGAP